MALSNDPPNRASGVSASLNQPASRRSFYERGLWGGFLILARALPKSRKTRPFFLTAIAILTFLEIVAFSPSSIEEEAPRSAVDPETLIPEKDRALATGIPKNRVPDYTVDRLSYISTQGTEKQWKLDSDQAYLFNHEKLVHAKKVKAFLYDPEGRITVVEGQEAKYIMGDKNLEIFGDVKARLPDGFQFTSPYLHYRPQARLIHIPTQYPVRGEGRISSSQAPEGSSPGLDPKISFESEGFEFQMKSGRILLPRSSRVFSVSPNREKTIIESDQCIILRNEKIAHFNMSPHRPVASRFVKITQPHLLVRSRRADLNYGDYSNILNYMVAYEDVLIQELSKASGSQVLKYATAGRASFDSKKNIITLTEFPQVYQDNDTVTGDVIIIHRDTDVVEVEHSNAFSSGQSSSQP